jgi:hypothetical protein
MDQKYFIWSPNFYIIFVAPPGTATKSTTINFGMNLLQKTPGINFGPNVLTWQKLIQSMAQKGEAHSVTLPDGSEILLPMSCITIAGSEMGTLINPHDREMIDVLTDLWDGRTGVWRKETKTSGDDEIFNPWINMIACTTPAWMAGNIPRHMIDAGFFSRTIFVYREKKRRAVAYPGDVVPDSFDETGLALLHDLEIIASLVGECRMSPEAKEWGTQWYLKHVKAVENNDARMMKLGTYASRKQTHLHKIAMVLSASHRDDLVVGVEEMKQALEVLERAEEDMERIYSLASDDRSIANANHLFEIVRTYSEIPKDVAFRMLFSRMGWEDFTRAVTDVTMSGRVKITQKGETVYLVARDEQTA